MPRYVYFVAGLAFVYLPSTLAVGQEVRYYEENGVTYQETTRTVHRPVVRTEWQDREQTVYRRAHRSEYRDTLRTYYTPVTQHEWITRMHGRWNPFVTPYYTHHLVPVTRWEPRSEVVRVPVVETEWVPEKRRVSVPVTTHRIAEEKVISRIAVGGRPAMPTRVSAQSSAMDSSIGGTALDGDPPRVGLRWRPPGGVTR